MEEYNYSEYIQKILSSQPLILDCWAFQNPRSIKNNTALRFTVNGFLHQGLVEVRYNEGEDLFDVLLLNDDKTIKQKQTSVYLDELVDTVDRMVERDEHYRENIMKAYFSSKED